MDLLRMDERQCFAWLRATRATLVVVGVTWVAMIVWELLQHRIPLFLIIMVPLFAALRLAFYLHYARSGP